jgi:hypothetical protein
LALAQALRKKKPETAGAGEGYAGMNAELGL